MEECLDIGTIDDILNFNSDDDEHKPPFSEQEQQEEELEWISNFPPVDEYVLAAGGKEKHHSPVSVLENSTSSNASNRGIVVMNCCGGLRVPARARSQRCRKRRKCFTGILRQQFLVSQENAKKKSRGEAALRTPILGRKCLHCGADKTPQWRAGPMGPKTLCNACGVRFKSGRLVPEYRPASSPTFSSQVHSNSHKKIIEMRRKRQSGISPVKPVDKG